MRRDWMVFAMQSLTAAVTVVLVVLSVRLTGTIRSQWDNTADIARREVLLGDISRTIGYGGMIHALKNYVLRGDEEYVTSFDASYGRATELIAAYRAIEPLSDVERESLAAAEEMVGAYRVAMNTAIRSDLGPEALDRLVRVDDTATLAAYDEWSRYLESQAQVLSQSEVRELGVETIVIGGAAVLIVLLGGALVTYTVVRARMREVEALSGAARELELANKAKTDFLANMSHEIRTPMTSIVGFSAIVAQMGGPELKAHTESINRNAKHLMSIVDDLLDIAVIEAGRLELSESEISPLSVAEDVRSMLGSAAKAKNLEFRVEGDASLPRKIRGDSRRLRQILLNLAGNSVKFTERGEVAIELSFQPADDDGAGGMLIMQVRDTGRGMQDEDIDRMFARFEQEDTTSTRRVGGVGLGLAISRSLVEAMGGTITVTSQPGLGSLFRVTLPVQVIDPEPWDQAADHLADAAGVEQASTDGVLSGLRVLVVEDGPDNRNLLSFFLSRAGAKIDFAENGSDAIGMITGEDPYDIVLMDMQMPVMDGLEATTTLRSRGFSRPILGLTAHAMDHEKARFIEAGCNAVMTKPVVCENLVVEVRRLADAA